MIVPGLQAAARGFDWVRQRMESGLHPFERVLQLSHSRLGDAAAPVTQNGRLSAAVAER